MSPKVTALTAQKRNPQRVNVSLDGEFAFSLARIVAAWLQVGQELSDEKIAQLQAQDAGEQAYQRALQLIEYRPHSQAEIRKNLQVHKVAEADIEAVLERLQQAGLVDDAGFARLWVENRSDRRPRSRRALSYELQQRGVGQQAIQQALAQLDEDELAYQAAGKQARKLHGLEWPQFRQKLYAFLARRGFSYETSASVIARVWAETRGDQRYADENEEEDVWNST